MSWWETTKGKIMGCVSEYIDQRGKNMATACTSTAGQPYWGTSQLQLAQQQMAYNNALAQRQAAMNNAWNSAGMAQGGYVNPTASPYTLATTNLSGEWLYTIEELNDEGSVYNMPLQTAVDLAINKFGSGWFKDETTSEALEENSSFWVQVMSKLWQKKRLERQQVRHFDRDEITTAWKLIEKDHGNS